MEISHTCMVNPLHVAPMQDLNVTVDMWQHLVMSGDIVELTASGAELPESAQVSHAFYIRTV